LCESGGAGGSFVRGVLWCGVLGLFFVFVFVVVVPGDVFFVVCCGVCGVGQ